MNLRIIPWAAFCFAAAAAQNSALAVSIGTVFVGNVGNASDATGFGMVDHAYRIGLTEVTNTQYAEFLNAKAANDPLGLYSESMGEGFGGITRSGAPGSYSYDVISGRGERPVTFVTWFDATRFVNWLHNGQGNGDTESGAYLLLGGTATPSNANSITRGLGATWFLPSEDEWYKAAYHKNDGVTGNYFQYPTSSDLVPNAEAPPGGSNSANYDDLPFIDLQNGGAYTETMSPYGAFDMGGNASEWNEDLVAGALRGRRGGSFGSELYNLLSSTSDNYDPSLESLIIGFRVATIPEPRSLLLAAIGASCLCGIMRARHRRRATAM